MEEHGYLAAFLTGVLMVVAGFLLAVANRNEAALIWAGTALAFFGAAAGTIRLLKLGPQGGEVTFKEVTRAFMDRAFETKRDISATFAADAVIASAAGPAAAAISSNTPTELGRRLYDLGEALRPPGTVVAGPAEVAGPPTAAERPKGGRLGGSRSRATEAKPRR